MFDTSTPSQDFLNIDEYRDKVLGCWTGKNIGGTLGAPMEGKRDFFDVKFYTQNLKGTPAPNDDLDLQLIWLIAAENRGIYNLNERILGEYWLNHIVGPWNEYGIGKINMTNGFLPPLSGAVNNDQWKYSNGAWIRSEIWSCLFAGAPDEVAEFAWMDACVDHCGDGIYAELFTATLEAAAFVESDLRKLIKIALKRIPVNSRVARSVKLAIKNYDEKRSLAEARNAIVADNADLGWFQAPANVAFAVLGLLYGEGDFGKSICCAVNCGDDTDCTGATVGAILGILKGRSGIPQEWIEPIGDSIQTVAIERFGLNVPETLTELTERTIRCKRCVDFSNPTIPRISDGPTVITQALRDSFANSEPVTKRVLTRSSMVQIFDLPFGKFEVEYPQGVACSSGEPLKLRLTFTADVGQLCSTVHLKWLLPENWSITPSPRLAIYAKSGRSSIEVTLLPGEFNDAFVYIPLELRLSGRNAPYYLTVPFQCTGSVGSAHPHLNQTYYDNRNRILAAAAEIK